MERFYLSTIEMSEPQCLSVFRMLTKHPKKRKKFPRIVQTWPFCGNSWIQLTLLYPLVGDISSGEIPVKMHPWPTDTEPWKIKIQLYHAVCSSIIQKSSARIVYSLTVMRQCDKTQSFLISTSSCRKLFITTLSSLILQLGCETYVCK